MSETKDEIKIGSWVKYSLPVIKDPFSGGIYVGGEVYAVVVGKLDNYVAITWKEDDEGGESDVPVFKRATVNTIYVKLICP